MMDSTQAAEQARIDAGRVLIERAAAMPNIEGVPLSSVVGVVYAVADEVIRLFPSATDAQIVEVFKVQAAALRAAYFIGREAKEFRGVG